MPKISQSHHISTHLSTEVLPRLFMPISKNGLPLRLPTIYNHSHLSLYSLIPHPHIFYHFHRIAVICSNMIAPQYPTYNNHAFQFFHFHRPPDNISYTPGKILRTITAIAISAQNVCIKQKYARILTRFPVPQKYRTTNETHVITII